MGRKKRHKSFSSAASSSEAPSLSVATLTLADNKPRSKIFPEQPVPSFHAAVRTHVLSELEGLDPSAVLGVKQLIKAGLNDQHNLDSVNLRESYGQAERFEGGVPTERFAKIARKEIKHKL